MAGPAFFAPVVVVAPSVAAVLAADLLGRVVASAECEWPPEVRREVRALVEALEAGGAAWEASVAARREAELRAMSDLGHGSTTPTDMGASSGHVPIKEAARMLKVGERQARRLLDGVGEVVGGVRLVDRAAVEALVAERAS